MTADMDGTYKGGPMVTASVEGGIGGGGVSTVTITEISVSTADFQDDYRDAGGS